MFQLQSFLLPSEASLVARHAFALEESGSRPPGCSRGAGGKCPDEARSALPAKTLIVSTRQNDILLTRVHPPQSDGDFPPARLLLAAGRERRPGVGYNWRESGFRALRDHCVSAGVPFVHNC